MTIGIGGSSRSGKTSLALLIKNLFEKHGQSAILLSQDDYAFTDETFIPKIHNRTDWEHPASIDFEWYKNDIILKQSNYQNVIAEGLFNFWDKDINSLFDMIFFTRISQQTFYERRKHDTRWGYEPQWYIEHVWQSYLKYGKSILDDPFASVVVLSGETAFNEQWIDNILGFPTPKA